VEFLDLDGALVAYRVGGTAPSPLSLRAFPGSSQLAV
jgi:hypothetical protein